MDWWFWLQMQVRLRRYRRDTERDTFRYLKTLSLSDTTVLDIGANKGIYSLYFSKIMLKSGEIWAFEPQPELKKQLTKLQRLTGPSLKVFSFGLSNSAHSEMLYRKKPGHGGASLEVNNQPEQVSIEVKPLDKVIESHPPIKPISLIKCDVENHELAVLQGAEATLRKYHPKLIVECHDEIARSGALFNFLESLDYTGFFFHEGIKHALNEWSSFPYRKSDNHRNYFFE